MLPYDNTIGLHTEWNSQSLVRNNESPDILLMEMFSRNFNKKKSKPSFHEIFFIIRKILKKFEILSKIENVGHLSNSNGRHFLLTHNPIRKQGSVVHSESIVEYLYGQPLPGGISTSGISIIVAAKDKNRVILSLNLLDRVLKIIKNIIYIKHVFQNNQILSKNYKFTFIFNNFVFYFSYKFTKFLLITSVLLRSVQKITPCWV